MRLIQISLFFYLSRERPLIPESILIERDVQGGSVEFNEVRWNIQERGMGWCSLDYFLFNVLENVQMSEEHANDLLNDVSKNK